MILSGKRIEQEIQKGNIVITPFTPTCVGPNSYNLKLHDELAVYDAEVLDMKKPAELTRVKIPADGFVLEPGKLYLGRTVEYTETRGLVPMLEGRSSIGRLGLSVHASAGFGDVGFRGYWTLQISSVQRLRIYPFVEVCQIFFHELSGEYVEYQSKKYQDNKDLKPSLLHLELNK